MHINADNRFWKLQIHKQTSFVNTHTHTHHRERAGLLSQSLNNVLRGLLPQGNDKPYFSWYSEGLIIQSLRNHMETASHSSFIKSFIAFTAEGAPFYELSNTLAVHLYVLQLQTFLKGTVETKQMTSTGLSALFHVERRLLCQMLSGQTQAESLKIDDCHLCLASLLCCMMEFNL